MALARILHTLSLRPDAQSKLREEVLEARAHTETGDLTYDELMALPYLDAVVKESLRL
jgi:cytochrome P450